MRVVLYDSADMEPITVINLPGLTEREVCRQPIWRIALPPEPILPRARDGSPPECVVMPVVEIWFERFMRRGRTHVMCFTNAAELAMKLRCEWLPGQRRAVQDMQKRIGRLENIIHRCIIG